MNKRKRSWPWLFIAAIVLTLRAAAANAEAPLASVQWLSENLPKGDLLVLDASPARVHASGHIPNAINVDVFSFGGRELSAADMERLIQSWGVTARKRVVLYDQGGTYFATSLFFDLYHHGFPLERLFVLDGGLAKWKAEGGAVTKEASPPPAVGDFKVQVREEVRVRLPEFLVGSGDPANHALVEALDPAQHFGGAKFFDRAGHVPNAIMAPAGDFFNADKTFKSPAEIRRMMAYLGVKPGQRVHTHCGGGIAASVPFFALKFMAGYPQVKLYKESQLEWLRDDRGLPFWTYDAPNQVRDKAWLSGWGSPMMRSFGVAKLSVVDVRPSDDFQQAHLPFAINVPADVFRRHVHSPSKLAEALGAAGVDPAHEAVIVSDRAVTPDSALAYVMLEKLGQKKVSVLAESVDDWGFAGLPLEKAGSATEPRKPPTSSMIRPVNYQAAARKGITIESAAATDALYPRIYVASGKTLPAKVPEGKVVHVPYTDLLNPDGTPRPAKDLWNLLVKAGIPRYAELVTIADDVGEAAAGYFVLRMMGYPDVKVLLPTSG